MRAPLSDLEYPFKFFNPARDQVTESSGTSHARATDTHTHSGPWKAGATSMSYPEVSIDGATNTATQTAGKNHRQSCVVVLSADP